MKGLKIGAYYEAKVCPIHTQNKGNVFKLDEQRLEWWRMENFDPQPQVDCGCLVEIPMDDVNFPERPCAS